MTFLFPRLRTLRLSKTKPGGSQPGVIGSKPEAVLASSSARKSGWRRETALAPGGGVKRKKDGSCS